MCLLAIIYFIAFLLYESRRDYRFMADGQYHKIKHGKRWRFRAMVLSPVVFALSFIPQPYGPELLYYPLISACLVAFAWWLLFDGLLNYSNGKGWWYTGTDDHRDADTDNFLQLLTLREQKIVKIGGIVLFLTLYILL